jgi:hypothetical protein
MADGMVACTAAMLTGAMNGSFKYDSVQCSLRVTVLLKVSVAGRA